MNPSSLTTLTEATFTPGATPAMPTPLMAAAIVPATCVPWSEVVGFHAASDVSRTPPMQDALLSLAICVARSGWVLGDAAVEHADHDGRAAGGDGVAAGVDLRHVPLLAPQRLGGRVARGLTAAAPTADGLVLVRAWCRGRRSRRRPRRRCPRPHWRTRGWSIVRRSRRSGRSWPRRCRRRRRPARPPWRSCCPAARARGRWCPGRRPPPE